MPTACRSAEITSQRPNRPPPHRRLIGTIAQFVLCPTTAAAQLRLELQALVDAPHFDVQSSPPERLDARLAGSSRFLRSLSMPHFDCRLRKAKISLYLLLFSIVSRSLSESLSSASSFRSSKVTSSKSYFLTFRTFQKCIMNSMSGICQIVDGISNE
jgi:hypothetical protein